MVVVSELFFIFYELDDIYAVTRLSQILCHSAHLQHLIVHISTSSPPSLLLDFTWIHRERGDPISILLTSQWEKIKAVSLHSLSSSVITKSKSIPMESSAEKAFFLQLFLQAQLFF